MAAPIFGTIICGACPAPEGAARVVQGYTAFVAFWYVYVLRSLKDNMFYVGSANDLKRRLQQHLRGENVSTAKRLPVELLYFEGHRSKDDAVCRERYFKTEKGKTTLRQMLRSSLQ